jgi:hypothetical protein
VPFQVVLFVFGVASALLLPMVASLFGVPLFWSQAIGIVVGWVLICFAFAQRPVKRKAIVGLAGTMAVATLISWTLQHVFE